MLNKIKRFKFDYILYLILGILLMGFGIFIMPFVSDYGLKILEIITAIFLTVYLIGFLLPRLLHKRSKLVLSFYIFEFVVVALLALGNVLSQFKILNISGVCETLGVTLFVRGLSELVVSYNATEHKKKFVLFLVDVLILSLGVFLVAKPLISDENALIILSILFILLAILLIAVSIKFWKRLTPAEKAAKNKKKAEKAKEKEVKANEKAKKIEAKEASKKEKEAIKAKKNEAKAKKEDKKETKKEEKNPMLDIDEKE